MQGLLFVHKKSKNFANLGHACFSDTGPVKQKFFASFLKKKPLLYTRGA
jgi:hypothetical protein